MISGSANKNSLGIFAVALMGIWAVVLLPVHAQDGAASIDPCTHLFDTGTKGAPIPFPPKGPGWTNIPDGELKHTFSGDMVFLNNKLAVALRRDGPGAEILSNTGKQWVHRATVTPCPAGAGREAVLAKVETIENSPSAVMAAAEFRAKDGRTASVTFRLTTGDLSLETRTGEGTSKVVVRSTTRYVVVPDFFGDDMVYSAKAVKGPRVGLPTETFLLNLIDGGDSIVMCVWQSHEQNTQAFFEGEGEERRIAGCEIECTHGRKIWTAFLEGPGLWHSRTLPEKDQGADVALDWKPPFPAKWRGDFLRRRGVAESWDFRDGRDAEFVSPGLGKIVYPCWLDADRAFVRAPGRAGGGPFIVYPIDRSRSTPLTVFCPIDVTRNTLGVGPCQYILAVEGIGKGQQETPAQVTKWIERQFKRKRAKRSADQIKEQLGQMVHHIEAAQRRIDQYADFAQRVDWLCAEHGKMGTDQTSGLSPFFQLRAIAGDMAQGIKQRREAMKSPLSVRQLADGVVALIGKPDALAECQKLGGEIRAIGAAQDTTLSKCRMAARRLRQQCRMAGEDTKAAPLITKIQADTERMLTRR